jgi:transposase
MLFPVMSEQVYSTYEVRIRAIEAVHRGLSRQQVSSAFGVNRTTLYCCLEKFEQGGCDSLLRQEGSGRPRLLEDISETDLMDIVLEAATQFGFESDLWTVGRLHQVIAKQFQVEVSKNTIWRRLVEAGLTYQKPERRYYEADEEIRKHWRRYEVPKIKRCVAKNKAILYFQDESNVSLTAFLGKT